MIDAAHVPYRPVSPNRKLALVASLALGVFVGGGGALGWERLFGRVRDPGGLAEASGLSVLGVLSRERSLAAIPRVIAGDPTVPAFEDVKSTAMPVVGHFPTNRSRKGTQRILAAINDLKDRAKFQFILVENHTHEGALRKMAQCDIVIDQLTEYGVYGNVAVEGMLMGKVVLSSVNKAFYDHCPVVPITDDGIEAQLLGVLESHDRWAQIGKAGIEYANAVHDPARVAQKLLEEYARKL